MRVVVLIKHCSETAKSPRGNAQLVFSLYRGPINTRYAKDDNKKKVPNTHVQPVLLLLQLPINRNARSTIVYIYRGERERRPDTDQTVGAEAVVVVVVVWQDF